jgi:hypothetical protein
MAEAAADGPTDVECVIAASRPSLLAHVACVREPKMQPTALHASMRLI